MPGEGVGVTGATLGGISFGVAADLIYNVFSATNSSPQTTELFAGERSDTLWKYVRLGGVQSAILIGVMVMGGKKYAGWTVAGGLLAGVFMWGMYAHALKAGQAKAHHTWSNAGADKGSWLPTG